MNNYQVNSVGRLFSLIGGMKRAKAILLSILLCLFSLLSLHLLAGWQQPTVAAISSPLSSEQAAPEMGNHVATNDVGVVTTFAEASTSPAPPTGKGRVGEREKGGAQDKPRASIPKAALPAEGHPVTNVLLEPGTVSSDMTQISATSPHRADGLEPSTIVVTATDSEGNPVSGATVWIVSSGTENTVSESPGTTDANGIFTAELTSTKAEAKVIRVLIGDGETMNWHSYSKQVEFTRSTITGHVFVDVNLDGVRQGGESALGGVQVTLYSASSPEVEKSTVTESDGSYRFTGLVPGTYRLSQTRLSQYAFSNSGVLTITVADFTIVTANDIGNYAAAQVSGQVWNDGDQDGWRQNGEPSLADVTINAYDSDNQLLDSTTTDSEGAYQIDLAAGLPTAPDNFVFNSSRLPLQEPASAVIGNGDFGRGLTPLDPATYPTNYDFSSGGLGDWGSSNATYVTVVDDSNSLDGPYLKINRYDQSAYSPPFVVPANGQSLQFDYYNWTERNSGEQSSLYVYVLSGPDLTLSTQIGTLYGSQNQGWQKAVLDLQPYQGQTIKLRLRTDTSSSRNGRSALDNVKFQINVPDWTMTNPTLVQVVSDSHNVEGQHLLLNRYEQSAYSPPFTVPENAQSLRFDYYNWTPRNSNEQSFLYIYLLSGEDFSVATQLGTLNGSYNQGWQSAVFDLQAYLGQTIKLRLRTDTSSSRNGRSRLDNVALYIESPSWTPSNANLVSIGIPPLPTDPNATKPENSDFSLGVSPLLSTTYPTNNDFSQGLTANDPSTYPANYDFATGDLGDWTGSNESYVSVVSDINDLDGPHLLINRYDQSAYSPPFVVPENGQSLRFDYFNWTERNSQEQSALYVYVLSGSDFSISTPIGTMYGSYNEGWQTAVLDLQAFQGQTIKLRLRTDTSSSRYGRSRIDKLMLQVEVPYFRTTNSTYVQVISDSHNLDGRYLLINRYDQSAYSSPFTVPEKGQTLRFDYFNWTTRNSSEQSPLYVYVLSGPDFSISTQIGTMSGSYNQGWQTAALDLAAFQDQTIKLRWRTDTSSSRNGRARIDQISVSSETPGWTSDNASQVTITDGSLPTTASANQPQNGDFSSTLLALPTSSYPTNHNFAQGLTPLAPSTYPTNYDFATSELADWTVSNETYVSVVSDTNNLSGPHLLLNRYEQSAYSSPFTVPENAQSLRFDYYNWTERNSSEQSPLYIYALSGPDFTISTQLGTLYGTDSEGWKKALLDLQVFQGQTIKLRFRTDTSSSRNGRSRIDNVTHQVEVPDWKITNATYVQVLSDTNNLSGPYLLLNRYDQSAYSPPFTVPADTQSLRFSYENWTERNSSEQSPLYVYALSGPDFAISTQLGTLYGTGVYGFQSAILDLQAFQNQTIKLHFRSDSSSSRNGRSRIDNISLNVETPSWKSSNSTYARIESAEGTDGPYLDLSRYDVSAYSSAFLVPTNTESLQFDYYNRTDRNNAEQSRLYVYLLSGENFATSTQIGTLNGSQTDGWKQASLLLTSFRGRVVKLRFRTDTSSSRNGKSRIDNITLITGSSSSQAGNTNNPDGNYLYLKRYDLSAYSRAFRVPTDAEELQLDYFNWTSRNATEQSRLYIYVLSGENFETSTQMATLLGSEIDGWQQSTIDLTAYQGQIIKLRLRTDTSSSRNGKSKIDNLILIGGDSEGSGSNSLATGSYLYLSRYDVSAYSSPFVVPTNGSNLRFDYLNWTNRNSNEQSRLYVYVESGPDFATTSQIATLNGSLNEGLQEATLSLTAYEGQIIKLRLRAAAATAVPKLTTFTSFH